MLTPPVSHNSRDEANCICPIKIAAKQDLRAPSATSVAAQSLERPSNVQCPKVRQNVETHRMNHE